MPLAMLINGLCLRGDTFIETKEGKREIKDLKRGDLILTKNGYVPLTKNLLMPSDKNEYEYVKIPKNRFGEVPSENLYISKAHPFSLGFYGFKIEGKKVISPGRSWVLPAGELVENVWGIELVSLKDTPYYNLIFDQEEEFSANGMICLSHHPNAEGYELAKNEFLIRENKFSANTKNFKWKDFIKNKLDFETMENFVERKLSFNRFDWIQYVNNYEDLVNNIKSEKEAFKHWLSHGKEEKRTFLSRRAVLELLD